MRTVLRAGGLGVVLTALALLGAWAYTSVYGPLFGEWGWSGTSVAILIVVVMLVLGIAFNAGGRPTSSGGGFLLAHSELRGREAQGTGPGAMVAEPKHELIGWAINIVPPLVTLIVLLVFF